MSGFLVVVASGLAGGFDPLPAAHAAGRDDPADSTGSNALDAEHAAAEDQPLAEFAPAHRQARRPGRAGRPRPGRPHRQQRERQHAEADADGEAPAAGSADFGDEGADQDAGLPTWEALPIDQPGRVRLYWDYHGLTQDRRPPVEAASHPDLEGAIVGVPWADIEAEPGVYRFGVLDAEIKWWWSQGKQVMIRTGTLGAEAAGALVPDWIYDLGVPYVEFQAGLHGEQVVTLPVVWDSPLFLDLYEDHVAALAEHYDGDPRVSFVWIGTGHLGLTVADPSRDGEAALLQAGWTPESWVAYLKEVSDIYAKHFVETPTVLGAGPLWTRSHLGDDIVPGMQQVATHAAATGASLLLKGLDPDPGRYAATPFSEMLDALAESQRPEDFTLFVGDNKPLWVDEERRANNPHEANRDVAGFEAALLTALSEWDRLGRACDLVLVLLKPEIQATNPHHPEYRPEVGAVLDEFLAEGSDR